VATVSNDETPQPPCCARHLRVELRDFNIPATLHLKLRDCPINVLIDTGCLQTNIVSTRIAALLRQDGDMMRAASVTLTSGVGGRSYGVQGIMTVNLSLMSHELKKSKRMRLRVLVCDDIKIDIIIGLPSIKAYNLLPVLTQHIAGVPCCEICGDEETSRTLDKHDGAKIRPGGDVNTHTDTARATSEERRLHAEQINERGHEGIGALAQHSGYSGEMDTLFAQINSMTDSTHKPTYEDTEELTQALQSLHMSQILGIDDDGADEDGPNDIDISRMNGSARNDDYTIGGSTATGKPTRPHKGMRRHFQLFGKGTVNGRPTNGIRR